MQRCPCVKRGHRCFVLLVMTTIVQGGLGFWHTYVRVCAGPRGDRVSRQAAGFEPEFTPLADTGAETEVLLHDWSGTLTPYKQAWDFQHQLVDEKLKDPREPDSLILVQHSPVYTLGTGSTPDNLLFDSKAEDRPAEVFRTERGGEVTYHGPGQLVAYPILDLKAYRADLHWYLRALEEVVIRTLQRLGIEGAGREEGLTGVWVQGKKVAAVGVKVKRWVTMHGIALNVNPDMTYFRRIVPCGISDRPLASVTDFVSASTTVEDVAVHMKEAFQDVFRARLRRASESASSGAD